MVKNIIKFILIAIFLVLGIFNIFLITVYAYYKSNKNIRHPITDSASWMTNKINRDTPLSKLNIPGSHDTLTYYWCDTFNPYQIAISLWAQTQKINVYDQLLCGCRYFDLRITWDNLDKKWYGIHGNFVNKNVTYEDALKDLDRFCKEYPKEIVIWKVIIQKTQNMQKSSLEELHKTYLDKYLIPFEPTAFNKTVNSLNMTGQVILSNETTSWDAFIYDNYRELVKEGVMISNPQQGKEVLTSVYSKSYYPEGSMPVLQWITVYDTHVFSSIFYPVFYHSNNLNKAFYNWEIPPSPKNDGKYGVILFDFVCEEYCRLIWKRNE